MNILIYYTNGLINEKFPDFFEKFHLTYYLLKIEIEMNEFTKKKISKTMTGRKKSATHKNIFLNH